jgi:hypothetical protein
MRRLTFLLTLAAAMPLILLAQDKPNFSGTWALNREKSVFPEMPGGGAGGPGGGRGMGANMGPRVIVHEEPSIQTKLNMKGRDGQDITVETKFTTDGKATTNKGQGRGPMGGTSKIKSKWEGARLVVNTEREVSTPNGDFTIQNTDEWTLSADGKEMTVLSKTQTPMGEIEIKYVFDKES